jgi:glycosyltransferase involved in cell wall biosynthesis
MRPEQQELAASHANPARRLEKVLVVVHQFPTGGGGRVDKFVKFLPAAGFEPIVLCARETDSPDARAQRAHLYPAALRAYHAGSIGWSYFAERYLERGRSAKHFNLLRWLSFPERCVLVPDHMVRWIPQGIRLATQLAEREGIRVVLTSSPPESTHLVGLAMQRKGLRWVADFRDLWTEKKMTYRPATRLHHRFILRLERKIFQAADHIIANTPQNLERYESRFGLPRHRLSMIPNGFDREDLPSLPIVAKRSDVFQIGYMGYFDKHDFPWRLFLDALKLLVSEVGEDQVRLVVCGLCSQQVIDYLSERAMTHLVISHGMLSHGDAMKVITTTDLRLLFLYENSYSHAIVPAKLYNYLIMPGPIFAIAPETGATASIIAATRMGSAVSPRRGVHATAQALRRYFDRWRCGELKIDPDHREIDRYDRRLQTFELARILRGLNTEA